MSAAARASVDTIRGHRPSLIYNPLSINRLRSDSGFVLLSPCSRASILIWEYLWRLPVWCERPSEPKNVVVAALIVTLPTASTVGRRVGRARSPRTGALREPVPNWDKCSRGFDSVRNPPFPGRFASRTLHLLLPPAVGRVTIKAGGRCPLGARRERRIDCAANELWSFRNHHYVEPGC